VKVKVHFTFSYLPVIVTFRLASKGKPLYRYREAEASCLNLKKLLASTCRQKILETLSKSQGINVMGVVRKINSTYNETNRSLKILEQEGIIHSEFYGRVRYIKLNRENSKTALLLQALKT
jgi:hypothetical protein